MTLEELKQLMRNKLLREQEAQNQALNLGDVEAYDRAATNIIEAQRILNRLDPPPAPEPIVEEPEPEPAPEPEPEPEPAPEPELES